MRLLLQFLVLAALTSFLALQLPKRALFYRAPTPAVKTEPFAAFVELSPEVCAARMKTARMAWQVRARAAGRLNLDDGTLLTEPALPAPVFSSSSVAFPAFPTLAPVRFRKDSLFPPSVAAPEMTPLPPYTPRPRVDLLDLSSYETLNER